MSYNSKENIKLIIFAIFIFGLISSVLSFILIRIFNLNYLVNAIVSVVLTYFILLKYSSYLEKKY